MKTQDLMTRKVLTCSEDDSLEQAAQIMWESDVGCLVVVDTELSPLGMITDRDIAMGAYTQGLSLRNIKVGVVMSRELIGCVPNTPLDDVESLMQRAQIRRLPVVDEDGKLAGIVTLGDIARGTRAPARAMEIPGLAKTLAEICQRRWTGPVAAE